MNASIEEYMQRVQRKLSRGEDQPVLAMAEALCFPSFHPETLLRATRHPESTTFRLATFTSSLLYSGESHVLRAQELREVAPKSAVQFWQSIEGMGPDKIKDETAIGADGMTVCATFSQGGSTTTFRAWSPGLASEVGKFVNLLYVLAWDVLKDRTSIERLEQLHGYMEIGLPARFVAGNVTTLRLFGSLTSNDYAELQRLFDSVLRQSPLVIDMTNFDGMGTVLYPIFRQFAKRHQCLAWACSEGAKRHLQSMGLSTSFLFATVEDAIASVSGK
jgi:anti-anti-sigma regulatory factor